MYGIHWQYVSTVLGLLKYIQLIVGMTTQEVSNLWLIIYYFQPLAGSHPAQSIVASERCHALIMTDVSTTQNGWTTSGDYGEGNVRAGAKSGEVLSMRLYSMVLG